MRSKIAFWALGGLILLGLGGSAASADTITIEALNAGASQNIGGVGYRTFTYVTRLSGTGYIVDSSDNFAISDVLGFAGFASVGDLTETFTGAAGTTWNATATTVGLLTTIQVNYSGNQGRLDGVQNPLVSVSFLDIFSDIVTGALFRSQDHSKSSGTLATPLVNFPVDTPGGDLAAIPLPAAAWGGMALFGLLGGAKLRRSRQSA